MWRGVIGGIVMAVLASGTGWADDQTIAKEKPGQKAQAEAHPNIPGARIVDRMNPTPKGEMHVQVGDKWYRFRDGIGVINDVGAPGMPQMYLIDDVKDAAMAATARRYSLGLIIEEVSDSMRAERKLPKDEGVLVRTVLPDTPAAKAGFKRDDVVVKAGKKPIHGGMDLVEAVQESEGKPLAIEILRDGKSRTITVKPAKGAAGRPGQEQETIVRGVKPPVLQWFTQPGWRWQSFRGPEPVLPDDMTVTITKTGKKPVQIVIKQGKQQWEAGENEVAKLPEAARPYVERVLGRGGAAVWPTVPPPPAAPFGPPSKPQFDPPYGPWQFPQRMKPALQKRLDEQLDEIRKRIDQLQDEVKSLQKAQPHSKP